jgi:hypothetical protein
MARQSEQLEREAEETRTQLEGALDELRLRLTPGQVVDQIADYAREGPAADFLRNLAREVQENPIPVLLIAVGIAWLVITASSRSPRTVSALDSDTGIIRPTEIAPGTAAPVEWSPEQRRREFTSVGAGA